MLIAAYKSGHNIRLIPLFRSADAVVFDNKDVTLTLFGCFLDTKSWSAKAGSEEVVVYI